MNNFHRPPAEHVRVRKSSGKVSVVNEGVHYDKRSNDVGGRDTVVSDATLSLAGDSNVDEPSAVEMPQSGVVRGDGVNASTYYFGDGGVLLSRKPRVGSKLTYAVMVGVDGLFVGGAGLTAALGLLPVSAALLAYSVNDSPSVVNATRDMRRSYGEETVSAAGVEIVNAFDSHCPSSHHGFVPVEDIASVRVYRSKDKAATFRHTGVEVVLNNGEAKSLSFSRQPTDQSDLVYGLAERMGEILGRPVDQEMRMYEADEIAAAVKEVKRGNNKSLLGMLFKRK
jgi:hypothetical protein